MDFSKYKTLIFDCDGVLLNSNFKKSEAYKLAALDYGASESGGKIRAGDIMVDGTIQERISKSVSSEMFLSKSASA